jgi:hypothetical protein
MAEIVQGLFGVSPELFKQQQDAQFRAQAIQEAQLDPQQQRYLQKSLMGRQVGRAIGGLLGSEDPMLARQTAENNVLQQVQSSLSPEDIQDPYKLSLAVYQAATQANLPELANNAYQNMQVAQNQAIAQGKDVAITSKNIAEANKAYREALPKIVQLSNSLEIAKQSGNKTLTDNIQAAINKEVELNKTSIENRMVELADKKALGTISNAELQELDYLDNFKTRLAKSGASSVQVNTDKSLAGKVGDIFSAELPAANASVDAIVAVGDIRKAISSNKVIVGPGATVRKTLAQVAQVYAGGTNDKQLANTRAAIQGLADLALTARARLKGTGSISNYEQETVEKATTGKIDDLTIPEIQVLADVVERNAKSTYNDYTRKLQSINDPDLVNIYSPKAMPTTDGSAINSLVEKYKSKR